MARKNKTDDVPGKAPGFWWYPADFERDVQMLPLSAQGLWARMIGWMHENEANRGYLELQTGEPMSTEDISARIGKAVREVKQVISIMERIGVFSRDDRGCIYCRRMSRETHISVVRREAAKARAEAASRSFAGRFAPAKTPAKHQQIVSKIPTVSDSVSVSVLQEEESTPPPPPDQQTDDRKILEHRLDSVRQLLYDFAVEHGDPKIPDDAMVLSVEAGLYGARVDEFKVYLLDLIDSKFKWRSHDWAYLRGAIRNHFGSIGRNRVITGATTRSAATGNA